MKPLIRWKWVQTWWGYTFLVVLVTALILAFGPKAWGQNPPDQGNFASVKSSQQQNGQMGSTSKADLTSLTGTGGNPTAFGKEVKSAYRAYVNRVYGKTFASDTTSLDISGIAPLDPSFADDPVVDPKACCGIHIPSPNDMLDALRNAVVCGSYMDSFDNWNGVPCKGEKAFESVVQDTAHMVVSCAYVTTGSSLVVGAVTGKVVLKEVIYTPERTVVKVAGGSAFLASMAYCAMQHWWGWVPG